MIIYPAIDIRGGKVVRLIEGDPSRQTIHADDPVEAAQSWIQAGSAWLHVVNLDGALGETTTIRDTLRDLAGLGIPVQFGGGLRSHADLTSAKEAGAARMILGTLAVEDPDSAGQAVDTYGADAIAVALDARNGKVAIKGWQALSDWTPVDLGKTLYQLGVRHVLYTDIHRDGKLTGVNVTATAELANATGLSVIASGGVATLEDVQAVKDAGLPGVIIGKALYSGSVDLRDAIALTGA